MTLDEVLIPQLTLHFPDRGLKVQTEPEKIVIFPSASDAVGDLSISFEGDEATVYVGKITHSHFSNYDDSLSPHQKMIDVSSQIINFLEALFNDKVLLWSMFGAGGCHRPFDGTVPAKIFSSAKKFVWSGPIFTKSEVTIAMPKIGGTRFWNIAPWAISVVLLLALGWAVYWGIDQGVTIAYHEDEFRHLTGERDVLLKLAKANLVGKGKPDVIRFLKYSKIDFFEKGRDRLYANQVGLVFKNGNLVGFEAE